MVRAYHLIFCAYGFWLPNDPRGSWSEVVRAWELRRFGAATKTSTRESVASAAHDATARREAKRALHYPPVSFNEDMIKAVAAGFADDARRSAVKVYACSIMPEHVHMVLARHRLPCEKLARQFRSAATRALNEAGRHPLADYCDRQDRTPKPWATGEWMVFLSDDVGIARAIGYVEQNPLKEGRAAQKWPFIVPV